MTLSRGGTLFEDHAHPVAAHSHSAADVAIPAGTIWLWYGTSASVPRGWAICDGTNGTPDMRGRVPVGIDTGQTEFDTLGEAGGAKTHTLTTAELASHGHSHTHGALSANSGTPSNQPSQDRLGDWTGGGGQVGWGTVGVSGGSNSYNAHVHGIQHTHAADATTAGSGTAHNNLQPYRALHFIMKLA
jgi:microcystin-dependent protein